MTRLLLQNDKKVLRQEYVYRFLNVILSFSIISVLIMAISMFPSFLNISIKYDSMVTQAEASNSSEILATKDRYEEINKEITNFISFFDLNETSMSELIDIIRDKERGFVSIQDYEVSLGDEDRNITVRGIAFSRESLVSFAKSVSDEDIFEEVDVPVASFTKESNLPFTLNINFADE